MKFDDLKEEDIVYFDDRYIKVYKDRESIIGNAKYGKIVFVGIGYIRVDLYNENNVRFAYNHDVHTDNIIHVERDDYQQEILMNDILINLNKLEKKIKKNNK